MFEDNDVDLEDYTISLVENPTEKEVMGFEGTKLLIDNDYVGIVYMDYDPRDFSADLEALLVFDKSAIKSFKRI